MNAPLIPPKVPCRPMNGRCHPPKKIAGSENTPPCRLPKALCRPLKISCCPPVNMSQLMHHATHSVLPPSEGVMRPSKRIMPPLEGMIQLSKHAAFQKYVAVSPFEGLIPQSEICCRSLQSIWRPRIMRSSDVLGAVKTSCRPPKSSMPHNKWDDITSKANTVLRKYAALSPSGSAAYNVFGLIPHLTLI